MSSLALLDDQNLVDTYHIAIDLQLDKEFIKIIESELLNRNLAE